MVLPKSKRHLNAKNILNDHDSIHGHRNLIKTERSVIACYRNFNPPKICKITVLFHSTYWETMVNTRKLLLSRLKCHFSTTTKTSKHNSQACSMPDINQPTRKTKLKHTQEHGKGLYKKKLTNHWQALTSTFRSDYHRLRFCANWIHGRDGNLKKKQQEQASLGYHKSEVGGVGLGTT